ncbi:MAG: ribbon-helix-helix protein CopG family [Ramlibacter sp.]|nr:ribbon-helix-helix protein CopG family [Ramlibacter sp.]
MELKTARLTVLIDPEKKLALEKVCAEQDVTPSQVVRRLIRDYIAQHGNGQRSSSRRRTGSS